MGNSRKRFLVIVAVVAIGLVIPITLFQLRQQQETRSRAGGGGLSLRLTPQANSVPVNTTFQVQVTLANNQYNITGIDITLLYDNSLLELVSFQETNTLNYQLINTISNASGTLRYAAVDTTTVVHADNPLPVGTLTFRAKTPGVATVGFQRYQATALGIGGEVPISDNDSGTYTVVIPPTATPTPTPTPLPTATPTLTPTPRPTNTPTPIPTNTPTPTPRPATPTPLPAATATPTVTPTPLPTATPTVTPTPLPTSTPTLVPPTPTPTPAIGDIDGIPGVDIRDFAWWRDEFLGTRSTRQADLDHNGSVDLLDFNIWRNAFIAQ